MTLANEMKRIAYQKRISVQFKSPYEYILSVIRRSAHKGYNSCVFDIGFESPDLFFLQGMKDFKFKRDYLENNILASLEKDGFTHEMPWDYFGEGDALVVYWV